MEKDTNIEELVTTELENDDGITQEERNVIYKEMEEMLSVTQDKRQKHLAELPTVYAQKKFKFPIVVNLLIVLFMLFTVGGVYAYFYSSDEKFFVVQGKTNFAENVLTQILINDIKSGITELQGLIDSITQELANKEAEQDNLAVKYEKNLETYKTEVDAEYERNLKEIRQKLIEQGLSVEALEEAFSIKQKELDIERQRKYNDFVLIQSAEKVKEEAEYKLQIAQLQNTLVMRQTEINTLEEKLVIALESEADAKNNLDVNKNDLADLQSNQEKKEAELTLLSFVYDDVIVQLAQGNMNLAQNRITEAKDKIIQSQFQLDSKIVRLNNRFSDLNVIINTLEKSKEELEAVNLNTSKENDTSDVDVVNAEITAENDKLKAELREQQVELRKQQTDIAQKDNTLQSLEKRVASISQDLKKAGTFDEAQISTNQKEIIKNVQLITLYLARKKQSLNVSSIEDEVRSLVSQDSYYRFISNIIGTAIDPSGELLL